ncbi:MAG: N-acetyltransferase [Eubacteriales bacterium]
MVRLAKVDDLEEIMRVYDTARKFMRKNGNMLQWVNGYPQRERLAQDIIDEQAYVYEEDGKVHGIFVLQFGEDETYAEIEGAWKNHEPYATIHRIGSDGEVQGVFDKCIAFSKTKCDNLRIDTHESNPIMKHLITKNGFDYCGVIYVDGLSPRIAFHYKK